MLFFLHIIRNFSIIYNRGKNLLKSSVDKQQSSDLISNYKEHKAYILFISCLRSHYTKIKYDGCLQKYLRLDCNRSLSALDQVLAKDPKVIEGEIIGQLIEMKNKGTSFSTLSVIYCIAPLFFYK